MKGSKHQGLLDPLDIRFAHSRIRPFFTGCGRRVEDTLNDIKQGNLKVDDLPLITVVRGGDGTLVSLNNRRLYVLKELRNGGFLQNNEVKVRIKPALNRELARYTKERCSLNATIMPEHSKGDGDNRGDDDDDESEHEDAGKDENRTLEKVDQVADGTLQNLKGADISPLQGSDCEAPETLFGSVERNGKGKDKKNKATRKSKGGSVKESDTRNGQVPAKVQKVWKSMQKDVLKGQHKKVRASLEDFVDEGALSEDQLSGLLAELGIER